MSVPRVLTVADRVYLARWAFCVEAQERYARRHGFAHVVRSAPVDGLNMKWSKLAHAADLLRSGAEVLLLDADAEPTPSAPSFLEAMAAAPGSGVFYVHGISGRPNSGVLMLRGAVGLGFLEDCLAARTQPVAEEHAVTKEGENGHVIQLLASGAYEAHRFVLPLAWNCSQPEHHGAAHIRHYTNRLRSALYKAEVTVASSPRMQAADADEVLLRSEFQFHRRHGPSLRAALEADEELARLFRDKVLALSAVRDLALPHPAIDDVQAWIARYECAAGILDLPALSVWKRLLSPGATVFDGGAHAGCFTRAAAAIGARVIATEPDPETFSCLRRNAGEAAACLRIALGAGNDHADRDRGGDRSEATDGTAVPATAVRVEVRSIDSVCRERGVSALDLLRLDAGGFLPEAIDGAAGIVSSSDDLAILLRCDPTPLQGRGHKPEAAFDRLAAFGFIPRSIGDDFTLGAPGLIDRGRRQDYLCLRADRWRLIEEHWNLRGPAADLG